MSGQRITIEVHDSVSDSGNVIVVKEKTKRKEHYKKYVALMLNESKCCGLFSYKAVVSLFKLILYAFTVLGDLLLMWQSNKKGKANNKSEKKKNILDGGW